MGDFKAKGVPSSGVRRKSLQRDLKRLGFSRSQADHPAHPAHPTEIHSINNPAKISEMSNMRVTFGLTGVDCP